MPSRATNVVAFNDQAVAKVARAKVERQTELKIAGVPGLSLVVKPTGAATYFVRYQVGSGPQRKQRREALGKHGVLSLHDARTKALGIMSSVANGADPVGEEQARGEAITLKQLWERRKAKDDRTAKSTLATYARCLEADLLPVLGDRPAAELTRQEIAKVLGKIEERSKHVAHQVRSALGSTFRWAVKRTLVEDNPTIGLGFTVQSEARDRVLSDDELAKLWSAVETYTGMATATRNIFKIALLTGQRISNVAGARVSELHGLDTDKPLWRIPAKKMKRKNREQIVPLSRQTAALFRQAVAAEGVKDYVFPADLSRVKLGQGPMVPHIRRDSIAHAMDRLRVGLSLGDARVHDFRRCVVTWLREHQIASTDVCEMILHHAPQDVLGRHYDWSVLEGPVRIALQAWADHVDAISRGAHHDASNVVALRG